MLVTRGTRATNIAWQGQAATSGDHCQWQIIVWLELSLTLIQTPKYKVQSSCWLMIEIFRLARLAHAPHVEVRACCALLVGGGWSEVINVQTVGLFTMCPCVQPPLLSIISTFGIIMQNDRFALQTVSRSAGGGGGQTRADPATFGPCPLLFTISTNIKHSTFSARAANEPLLSFTITKKAPDTGCFFFFGFSQGAVNQLF